MTFKLYHYWRSSSSWRVRWGLEIKGVKPAELVHVSLLDGESESPEHRARNPLGYVPVLEFSSGPVKYLGESMAILEWLEETYPQKPSLFPREALLRARARQLAEIINAGTQPVQNLTVQLVHAPDDPAEQKRWNAHWTSNGLAAYETLVRETAGRFSIGDQVTIADLMLIPQCYNALRQDVDLARFPTVKRIYEAARATPECRAAEPEKFEPPATR